MKGSFERLLCAVVIAFSILIGVSATYLMYAAYTMELFN